MAAWRNTESGPINLGAAPKGALYTFELPCGKCLGCRQTHATTWALRARHEATQWNRNTFLTLTYDEKHLPEEGHLDIKAPSRFINTLRQRARRLHPAVARSLAGNIKYLACGEYGELNQRPHYHLLLFNCGLNDCTQVGDDLYESDLIKELWTQGHHRAGEATPGGAAGYIAKYTLKRMGNSRLGEVSPQGVWRPAPFLRMSLRPAIGHGWLHRYHTDLRNGFLESDARQHAIPRYYRKKLKELYPQLEEEINWRITEHRKNTPTDRGTQERRLDAMKIHQQKNEKEKRKL